MLKYYKLPVGYLGKTAVLFALRGGAKIRPRKVFDADFRPLPALKSVFPLQTPPSRVFFRRTALRKPGIDPSARTTSSGSTSAHGHRKIARISFSSIFLYHITTILYHGSLVRPLNTRFSALNARRRPLPADPAETSAKQENYPAQLFRRADKKRLSQPLFL